MTDSRRTIHDDTVNRLSNELAAQGYQVTVDPSPFQLPDWLTDYAPDLVASRGDDHLAIEVKLAADREPIGRLSRIAENINSHQGWRFVLVNAGDSASLHAIDSAALPPWSSIVAKAADARRLEAASDYDSAFLKYWTALEAALRTQAIRISLPADQLPTSALLKHLYSQGEISIPQFDLLQELGRVRNSVVHGFNTPDLASATKRLGAVVNEILEEWTTEAHPA